MVARYFYIVISASIQLIANKLADNVNPGKNEKTFTVGLSATGQRPATHYWSGWYLTNPERASLFSHLPDKGIFQGKIRYFDSNEYTPEQVLGVMGLKRIEVDEVLKRPKRGVAND